MTQAYLPPGGAEDSLLALLADPEASKKRIEELKAVREQIAQAQVDLIDSNKKAAADRAENEKLLAKIKDECSRNEHLVGQTKGTLATQQQQLNEAKRAQDDRESEFESTSAAAKVELDRRTRELEERAAELDKREAKTAEDAERADRARDLYEGKLAAIQKIANPDSA